MLALTFTRGPWIALAVGLLAKYRLRLSWPKLVGVAGVCVVAALLFPPLTERFQNFDSLYDRYLHWVDFVSLGLQRPWLGYGIGTMTLVSSGVGSHNDFVLLFVETGLVGLTTYVLVLFVATRQVWRYAWAEGSRKGSYGTTALAVWATFLALSLTEHPLSTLAYGWYQWFWVGIACASAVATRRIQRVLVPTNTQVD